MWAKRVPKASPPPLEEEEEGSAEWRVTEPEAPVEAYVFPSAQSAMAQAMYHPK